MKQHIHCKICKLVIEKPDDTVYSLAFCEERIYYKLEVCMVCVIKKGIKGYKRSK